MKFIPEKPPFPYWEGPYSPSRGNTSGFRVKNGRLVCWINTYDAKLSSAVLEDDGVSELVRLVTDHWGGGRVLFLPAGIIVKPLRDEDEVGLRKVVGRYEGGLRLQTDGGIIDLSSDSFILGEMWPGPSTIGLECSIESDGSLSTEWKLPSEEGKLINEEIITSPNQELMENFRNTRPGATRGRVRVTVCGHAFTFKKVDGAWKPFYIGQIDTSQFVDWGKWINGGNGDRT